MKMLNSSADTVQGPKREAPAANDTYRAPRLVTLGTAVGLVQCLRYGRCVYDYCNGYSWC